MFVAISTRCFADIGFDDACAQIVDLEFDKIELWVDDGSEHLTMREIAGDPDGFVTRYREITRLTPAAIAVAHDVSPAAFRDLIRAAKQLRVTQLSLPASDLGTPFNAEIERLRELAGVANREGVRLSIRTVGGTLAEDPHTAVELCQAVSGLGLTLDPSYYLKQPAPERAIDLALPHTFHVHLRDSTATALQVQVGLGELDYNRLIAQLRRLRYSRALCVELLPELTDPTQRPLELRKMRMLLESLL